ncbi:DUF6703 family protein [Actinoplanes teichomyceticus]|uniref:DUF6703 family protein n=1 Tax=Actinoplanes teichomyceticus TaxID=1867 RepID=UPI0027DAE8F9|nr:DUF6703 family protein [Actinoplanes teichomyceticus]
MTRVRTPTGAAVTTSDHFLRRLARVNPTVAFVAALALLLAGLFLPGIVGALLLGVLAAGLATLTFTTWPVQSPVTRVVRVVLLTLLVVAALSKVL